MFRYFLAAFTIIFNGLFCDHVLDNMANEKIQVSEKIISQSDDLIKEVISDKIYLDEERIYLSSQNPYGYDLVLDSGQTLFSSFLLVDEIGPFLSISHQGLTKKQKDKIFKNVCNNCDFEWCGGFIVLRCPKCGSKDFRTNVPNW